MGMGGVVLPAANAGSSIGVWLLFGGFVVMFLGSEMGFGEHKLLGVGALMILASIIAFAAH
jgi:hypothetical protein